MSFSQQQYIAKYNKDKYKLYQFRVRKDDVELIKFLDNVENRNKLIIDLVKPESQKKILSFEDIKKKTLPIADKYGIKEVFLFGSYARGEATINSDVDLLCSEITIEEEPWGAPIIGELEEALGKKVDVVFKKWIKDDLFLQEISKDLKKIK